MSYSSFEQQLKANLPKASASPSLLPRILQAMSAEQRRLRFRHLAIYWAQVATGFLVLSWSLWQFSRQLAASGAGALLRLLVTDTHTVLIDWQAYTLSLLESLPIITLVLVLASIGFLVWLGSDIKSQNNLEALHH